MAKEYRLTSKYFLRKIFSFASASYLSKAIKFLFLVGVCEIRLLLSKLCVAEIFVENESGSSSAARSHKSVSSPAPLVMLESKPFNFLKKLRFIPTAEVQARASTRLYSK